MRLFVFRKSPFALLPPAIALALTGCSGMSYKEKSLSLIAASVAAGYLLGPANTPQGESASTHGLLWAGLAGTAGGVGSPYIFKDDLTNSESLEELENLRNKIKIENSKKEKGSGINSFLEKPLPKEFSKLVNPGGWKIYQTDEWIKESDERLIHQDKIIEITLPEIKEH